MGQKKPGEIGGGPCFVILAGHLLRLHSSRISLLSTIPKSILPDQNTDTPPPLIFSRNDATCAADGNRWCSLLSDLAVGLLSRSWRDRNRSQKNMMERHKGRHFVDCRICQKASCLYHSPIRDLSLTFRLTDIDLPFNSDVSLYPQSTVVFGYALHDLGLCALWGIGQLCSLAYFDMHTGGVRPWYGLRPPTCQLLHSNQAFKNKARPLDIFDLDPPGLNSKR